MPTQISLFEKEEKTLLTDRQREIEKNNPFFNFFSHLAPELVVSEDFQPGGYYLLSTHPLLEAFYTAQTRALEAIYRALDVRFLDRFEGSFDLACDGKIQTIRFVYEPDQKDSIRRTRPKECGANLPRPYIEFHSEEPSILSWTGFYHSSMNAVPFEKARTIEELVEIKVKEISGRDDCMISFH
jgi:hypothetical protein